MRHCIFLILHFLSSAFYLNLCQEASALLHMLLRWLRVFALCYAPLQSQVLEP